VVVPEARCDDDEDGTPVFSCVAAMGRRFFFSFFYDDGSALLRKSMQILHYFTQIISY
jgi:hypothetical protein